MSHSILYCSLCGKNYNDVNKLINTSTGAYLSSSGNWTNSSSRTVKENHQHVDSEEILDKIEKLSITEWNYKENEDARHIGPVAEDFYSIFNLGENDKSISTIDPSGVALAGIKGLIEENKALKETIDELIKRIEALEKRDD